MDYKTLLQSWISKDIDWKEFLLELWCQDTELSEDESCGMDFFTDVLYRTVCKTCGDENAFLWLEEFALAKLKGEPSPAFPQCCKRFATRCVGSLITMENDIFN
jgi:hypothetical protein